MGGYRFEKLASKNNEAKCYGHLGASKKFGTTCLGKC